MRHLQQESEHDHHEGEHAPRGRERPESSQDDELARDVNQENVPNVRQSRVVLGVKKLKANRMKIAELTITRDQRPQAGI